MKVLITGGAGFIGSHLADRLLARGDEVLVIDNYATGRRDNLRRARAASTIVEGTIADAGRSSTRPSRGFKPDVVVHAAASYKDPDAWAEDARTNALGTANVVQAAQAAGVERLIYFQTALCYGLQPLEQPITLDHPIRPEARATRSRRPPASSTSRSSGLDWVSFRLANAYGPRNSQRPAADVLPAPDRRASRAS